MSAPSRHFPPSAKSSAFFALILLLASGCATVPPGPGQPGTGSLQIFSNPSGARIIIDGSPTNFRTPTTIPGIATGRHRVLLSLSGHRNWEGGIRVSADKTTRIDTILEPIATGSLGIASTPGEAAVLLDGRLTGLFTPAEFKRLPVGTHTLQLRRNGYEPWSQAVVIIPDRQLLIPAILTPSRKDWGHLQVQSHPPHARISLDGAPTGKRTPDTLYNLQAGTHRLELSLQEHLPWSGTIVIREKHTENLLVKLQSLPVRKFGAARVESIPPGAAIRIDGVALEQKTPMEIEDLAVGAVTIELTLPGYRTWRGELLIAPQERALCSVQLTPETIYGGSLRVETDPPGAAIAIDDQPTGAVTPTLLPNLSAANHRLSLTLPGHRDVVRMVTITEGASEQVKVRLVRSARRFAAKILSESGEEIEIEFAVRDAMDIPAEGILALFLASNTSWQVRPAKVPLTAGVARVQLTLTKAIEEASITVGVEEDRATFRLQRRGGRWEINEER